MELPKSKPIAEIKAMKQTRRQGYVDNRQRIINHLKKRGLRNVAIAGIIGNIDIETGGTFDYKQRQTKSGNPRDPNVTPGGAYGLFQFDDPGKKAGHETWYKQYLEKTDKTDSAESQLDYVLDTINAGENTQDPFYNFSTNVGPRNAGTIKGYFKLSEDPKQVSDSFTDRFLRPGKSHSDKRRASAEATFAELQPVDPDNQNIDQPGNIVDTGDDTPMEEEKFPMERVQDIPEEKSMYESIKPYVPVLRHFNEGGAVPMQKQMEMFDEGGLSTRKDSSEDLVDTFEITPEMQESMDKMTKEEQDAMRKKLIAEAMERMLAKPLSKDIDFSKIARQYNEGGLMDEGGSIDPVSGNDVPPGSTQEEVRDDIPAQLSEGEFVFPADVVRFIGLNNLMQMRQQAKMGLKQMEEMGQMGNSEEATMPDDLPFDINDLDMEDEDEYNTRQEFAVGGMPTPNPNTGVYYNPTTTAPTTGVAQQAASSQYVQPVRPVQAEVPTAPVYKPAEVPTFKGFVGENVPGVDFEYVEYKDEAGNVIKLRKSLATGDLLDPVPEGYTFVDSEATKVEEATVAPTTPQTTTVREDKGDADHAIKEEEKYGPGGGRLGVAGEIYGVSFDNMGTLPGALGAAQGAVGLATGKPLPSDAIVNFKQGDLEFSLTGYEYNQLKDTIKSAKKGANSDEAEIIFDDLKKQALKRKEIQAKINAFKASEQLQQQQAKQDKKANKKGIKDAISFEQLIGSGADDERGDGSGMDVVEAAEAFQQEKQDSGESKPDQSSGSSTGGYYDFNQGGLASKPKPKIKKKMKRGGLASKK